MSSRILFHVRDTLPPDGDGGINESVPLSVSRSFNLLSGLSGDD